MINFNASVVISNYMNQVIGGEFEIDYINSSDSYPMLPKEFCQGHFYSSGRAALYYILNFSKQAGMGKILLPDYLCISIVEIVKLASIPFEFYKVNQDLTIDIDSLIEIYESKSSILIINYFGGVDIQSEIQKVRSINSDAFLILDNVQALFSMFESFDVDFMFTSFRKQLPVPDGAWVISKHNGLFQCEEENKFAQYKFAGGLLKKFRKFESVSDQLYLELFEKGEIAIMKNLNSKISDITITILSKLNFDLIRQKRINNSMVLIEGLQKIGIKPILKFQNKMVPLFVPILIKDRDRLRMELRNNNIFCPIHWPKCNEINTSNHGLYETELSLVIDQRYDQIVMNKILTVIAAYRNNGK